MSYITFQGTDADGAVGNVCKQNTEQPCERGRRHYREEGGDVLLADGIQLTERELQAGLDAFDLSLHLLQLCLLMPQLQQTLSHRTCHCHVMPP